MKSAQQIPLHGNVPIFLSLKTRISTYLESQPGKLEG